MWRDVAVVGALLVCLSAAGATFLDQEHKTTGRAQHTPSEQARSGPENVPPSPVVRGAENAADAAANAKREEQRDEEDLQAQKDMAKWAYWMVITSFASFWITSLALVLSTVGVVLLKYTLDATRVVATEAAKATDANIKAAQTAEDQATFNRTVSL